MNNLIHCLGYTIILLTYFNTKKRIRFFIAATAIVVVAYILMLGVFPLMPLVMLGVGYAIFGAIIWPTISYIVPDHQLGIAFGVLTSI